MELGSKLTAYERQFTGNLKMHQVGSSLTSVPVLQVAGRFAGKSSDSLGRTEAQAGRIRSLKIRYTVKVKKGSGLGSPTCSNCM